MDRHRPEQEPVFFLSFNRFDHQHYLTEQCWHFVNACDLGGFNYHLEIHPIQGHSKLRTVAESVRLFDTYRDAIADWETPEFDRDDDKSLETT